MKPVVVLFLSGLATMATGALIRSCQATRPAEFANAWCGLGKPHALTAMAHAHCAGCALLVAGFAASLLAGLLLLTRDLSRRIPVRSRS